MRGFKSIDVFGAPLYSLNITFGALSPPKALKYGPLRKSGEHNLANENLGKEELEKLYRSGLSLSQIGKIFGMSRSGIRWRMVKYGIKRRKQPWTNEELTILKELYPKGEKQALMEKLQDRTWTSILTKSSELRLKSPRPECRLTREELEKLYRQTSVVQAASTLNISLPTLYRWLTKARIALKGFEKHPHLTPSPELLYVLEVLRGDGFTRVIKKRWHYSVRLRTISKKFAKSFTNALRKIGLNPHISMEYPPVNSNRHPVYVVIACSKKFVAWYRNLDNDKIRRMVGENAELATAFVRGFYESEGSYYLMTDGRQRMVIYNTQPHLLLIVKDFLSQLGYVMKFGKSGKTRKFNQVYVLWKDRKEVKSVINAIRPCIKKKPSNLNPTTKSDA